MNIQRRNLERLTRDELIRKIFLLEANVKKKEILNINKGGEIRSLKRHIKKIGDKCRSLLYGED